LGSLDAQQQRTGKGGQDVTRITLVSGLSLLPLLERHPELSIEARKHAEKTLELGRLRDKCTLALAHLKDVPGCEAMTKHARKVLRRRNNPDQLDILLNEIVEHAASHTQSVPINLRGNDIEIEGHKEPDLNHNITSEEQETSPIAIEDAFPRLCNNLRRAKSRSHYMRIMDAEANYMALGPAWNMAKEHGPQVSFIILGYILERLDRINNPRGYALKLLDRIQKGFLSLKELTAVRMQQTTQTTSASGWLGA